MKYSIMRRIALILVTVMLSVEVLSPVYAAQQEGHTNEDVTENVTAQETSGQAGTYEEFEKLSEEEQQVVYEKAIDNVEAALERQSSDNTSKGNTDSGSGDNNDKNDADKVTTFNAPSEVKAVSNSGNVRVDMYTDEKGEKNFLFNGSENLNYDPSKADAMPGMTYVGTGDVSGMDVYKNEWSYDELDDCYDECQEEIEEENETVAEIIEYVKREGLSDDEIDAAIDAADEFSADVREECFIYVASISEASGSEALQKYIKKSRAAALGIFEDEEADVASPSEASGSETGDNSSEQSDGVLNIYRDGAVYDDTSSGYDFGDEASESDAMYANNMVGDDWVQIVPTENIYTDDIIFDHTTIEEFDNYDADGNPGNSTPKEAQVLIARKDVVYFQVNQLDENGKKVGGLNNAAVYIEYKKSNAVTKKRSGVTARVDDRDGYISFDDMKGMYDCFINISFPGDATQTYYTLYVEGGHLYEFNLRPVKKGDIYLRGAGIDGVDIMTFGYRHVLSKTAQDQTYNFSYLVDVYDPSGQSTIPEDVYLVSVPQRPADYPTNPGKYEDKKREYRDKVFHFKSQIVDVRGQKSRKFTWKAPWSQVTYTDNIPYELPSDGDNPEHKQFQNGGTRLVPDSTTYLELQGDLKWSENGQNRIKLLLEVKEPAPGWEYGSQFTLNLFGVPTSSGASGGGISFDTPIPGLRKCEINVDFFSFNFMAAIIPTGYAIGGYKIPIWAKELVNTCKEFNNEKLLHIPRPLAKMGGLIFQYNELVKGYRENSKAVKKYINSLREKYDMTHKTQWTSEFSLGVVAFGFLTAEFNWHQNLYGATVTAGVCAYGTGGVTGYAFIGPVPRYCGLSATGSVTVSGGVGFQVTVTDSGHYTRLSPGSSIGLDFSIGVTAFAGLGIRNFFGAELTGGGNIGGGFKAAANPNDPPVQITGGWDIGIRAYFFFIRWKSTIIAKNYQLYPKKDNAESIAGDSPGDASESQLEDFTIVTHVAEGRAIKIDKSDGSGEYIETFEPTIECNDAGEYTDETEVAKTTEIASSVVASSNIRYVSGKTNGGILARIADVETQCADGKTRVIPRVIWASVKEKGIEQKFTGVVNTTSVIEEDRFEEWEAKYEYGYDYSFDVQMVDDDYVDITILSGPVNQEELDKKAAEEAIAKGATGDDIQKAIVKCRATYQHIRVYRMKINGETSSTVNSKIAPKTDVYDETTKRYTHEYAYLGTPVAATFKGYIGRLGRCGYMSTWVTCPISLDIFSNQQRSSGYMISNWLCDKFDRYELVDSKVCVDGISRTKMLIANNSKDVDPRYPGEENCVCLFSLISDGSEGTSSKTIQRIVWRTSYWFLVTYSPTTTTMQEKINNFSHVNNDPREDIYFTSGKKLYCLNIYGGFSELKITSDEGNEVKLSEGDGSLAYFRSQRTDGTEKINIITISNEQNTDRPKPVEGEDAQIVTKACIVIYDFLPDGENKLKCKGKSISEIKNKVITRFDAAFTQMGEHDKEAGIKVYYMANYREDVVQDTAYDFAGVNAKIKTVHEKCDLFVWNWVADYGAVVTDLSVPVEVIPYGSKSFALKVSYKNVGPRYIDGGVKVSYVLRKGGKDEPAQTIEINGDSKPGETKENTINIPIPKDKKWDGWVTVKAQITEVKVNGKWITSNEAGFKPVWVESDKLKGKIKIQGESRPDDDCQLSMTWSGAVSKPEHLAVKVYRQRTNASQSELTWEKFPSAMISLDNVKSWLDLLYIWNCTYDTSNTKYWYGGLYKDAEGTIPINSRNDEVKNVKPEEWTTAVKFELCGYGDDTLNVSYSDVVINNPLLEKLCQVSIYVDDPDAMSILSGPGYYLANNQVNAAWSVNEGYRVYGLSFDHHAVVGVPEFDDKHMTAVINPGYHSAEFKVETIPAFTHFHVKAFTTTDNLGTPHASIRGEKIYRGVSYDLPASGGSNEYTNFMIRIGEAEAIKLTAQYDKSKYRFTGWYEAEYVANPGEAGLITYESDMSSEDPAAVYETHYLSNGHLITTNETIEFNEDEYIGGKYKIIKAILVPQDGYKITFDPNGGSLLGLDTAYTNEKGYLSNNDIKDRNASLGGYRFNGWIRKDGKKITDAFTEDTTVYADFTKLAEHEFIVTSTDPMVGKIEVDGQMQKSIQLIGYNGAFFALRAYPDEDYELDTSVWKVFSKDASGNYTVAEAVIPQYDADKDCYLYTMPDKDIKVVAQIKKKAIANTFYITLDTEKDDYGLNIATLSVTTPSSLVSYPEITVLRDGRFKVAYAQTPASYTDIIVETSLFRDLIGDYVFTGWREIIAKPDGTITYGDIISTNTRLILNSLQSDKKLYAEWTKREPQGIVFAKPSVSVEADFPGGMVNALVPPTDRDVTYFCSNKDIIKVNPTTGALSTPSSAGSVEITANIAAGGIYASEQATYELTVKKATQSIAFKESEITASLASPSFTNELTGAKSKVHYTSSNPAVADVDYNTGVVTPNKVYGNAVITAVADGNGLYYESKASFTVHITPLTQTIFFSQPERTVTYGCDSFIATPCDAQGTVSYRSSDTEVASVDHSTGEVRIMGSGIATISAVAAATDRYLESNEAEYKITVCKASQNISFASDSCTVRIGEDSFTNTLKNAKTEVHYTSSDPMIASVNELSGLVTIGNIKTVPGSPVVITARAQSDNRYEEATATYTINVKGRVQFITFENKLVRKAYEDEPFIATPSGAVGQVAYTSTNTDVATVNQITGEVTIVKPGETTIEAKAAITDEYEESNTARYTIVVSKRDQKLELATASIETEINQHHTNLVSGVKTSITFTSSNESVATVSPSVSTPSEASIYTHAVGTAVITAKAAGSEYYNEAEKYFTVVVGRVESDMHFSRELVTTVATATDSQNILKNWEGQGYDAIQYSSSDNNIVTVTAKQDNPGEHVLNIKKSGKVTITAEAMDDHTVVATSTYTLNIRKADSLMYFENPIVEVFADDEPFIATLNNAKGAVTYRSKNPDVATVDAVSGKVTLKGIQGEAVIEAEANATDIYDKAFASYTVEVSRIPQLLYFEKGRVTIAYNDDNYLATPSGAKTKVTYYSSHPEYASVDRNTGEVTAVHPGDARIYAVAEETERYSAAAASYEIEVTKARQNPYFKESYITRRLETGTFINEVLDAEGEITYVVDSPSFAHVDSDGTIHTLNVGKTKITASVSETEYYKAAECDFDLNVIRALQNPYFAQSTPKVTYGSGTYANQLLGAKAAPKYSIISYEPRAGVPSGSVGATIDEDTGVVTVLSAGDITIRAMVPSTDRYESATATYKLTVSPKEMKHLVVSISEEFRGDVVVVDGIKVLEEGTDYRFRLYESTGNEYSNAKPVTLYEVEGIGNYTGTKTLSEEKKQIVEITETFEPLVSEDIPVSQREEAHRIISQVDVSGFDIGKVPVEQIKQAVTGTGEGKISAADMNAAAFIEIITDVRVSLESIDNENGEYKYKLDPWAAVLARKADGTVKTGYTQIKAEWLDGSRTITVTLGTGNSKKELNRVIHQNDDGSLIQTYVPGSAASGTTFHLDINSKTVTLCIEHCSEIIIKHVDIPTPKPSPTPRSGGGGGGGGMTDGSDWNWYKDTEGFWHLKRFNHEFKDEWVYAYNPYSRPDKGQKAYSWFSFDEKGRMRTGWFKDKDGKWYFLENQPVENMGAMYEDCLTPDGFRVDKSGVWNGKPQEKKAK